MSGMSSPCRAGNAPCDWLRWRGRTLGIVALGSVVLGSVVLGSVVLGSVVLGSVVLGSVVLGSVVLGSVVLGSLRRRNVTLLWRVMVRGAVFVGAVFVGAGAWGAAIDPPPSRAGASDSELAATIAQWIEQLGDPQYFAREKAQENLQRLGTEAFDALLAAQDHVDVEIAMRARYLVRSMSVSWTKAEDTPEMKQLFREYSSRDRQERATRAQHFATLADPAGTAALCRIMRFDVDRVLSKQAAVLILNRPWPDVEGDRLRRAELVRREVASSTRKGADWLRLYARSLESPAETERDWGLAVRGELEQLARHPPESDRRLVTDLIRWQTLLQLRLDHRDDALRSIRLAFDLLSESKGELYDLLDWTVENGLHETADELAAHFPKAFGEDPRLLYRLAESQLKRGQRQVADATADRARGLVPDKMNVHLALAKFLQFRVLTDWAEKELRYVVAKTQPTDEIGAPGRWALAEMLFDAERELEAAEITQSLVTAAAKNPRVLEFLMDPELSHLQGYMHYYFGMHFARQGDRERQQEYFRKAIGDWPENPDFIIALYRVPGADDEWRKDVLHRIEAFAGDMRKEVRAFEMAMQQPMNDEERNRNGEFLASRLNEFAWLIANTEGDKQEALRFSQRSLELRPDNPAYLDTLGRCYFAVGDYENAVRVQSRAVKLMPSMFVMQRQLSLFEKAWTEFKAARPAAPPAGKSND